jgi:hypothetical protein
VVVVHRAGLKDGLLWTTGHGDALHRGSPVLLGEHNFEDESNHVRCVSRSHASAKQSMPIRMAPFSGRFPHSRISRSCILTAPGSALRIELNHLSTQRVCWNKALN